MYNKLRLYYLYYIGESRRTRSDLHIICVKYGKSHPPPTSTSSRVHFFSFARWLLPNAYITTKQIYDCIVINTLYHTRTYTQVVNDYCRLDFPNTHIYRLSLIVPPIIKIKLMYHRTRDKSRHDIKVILFVFTEIMINKCKSHSRLRHSVEISIIN